MFRKSCSLALAAVFMAANICFGAMQDNGEIRTVPGELDFLRPGAHPQGVACSESAVYVAYSYGIMKLDWNGRLIKTCGVPEHLGDLAYADGRIYGVIGFGFDRKDARLGLPVLMVGVWNEDLACLGARTYDNVKGRGIDGAVVLGDTLYTCIDDSGRFGDLAHHPPHRDTTVMMLSTKDLSCKAIRKIELDYPIHYCPQTLGTDGKNLLFVSYGARPEEGNDPWLNYTRLTPDLKQIGKSGTFFGQWGFSKVPESVAGGDDNVFFTVDAIDIGQWGAGQGKKPPQLKLRFFSYNRDTGAMQPIAAGSRKSAAAVSQSRGFWRVEQRKDGRWWAISPEGRDTFLRGVDHVNWGGMWCEALGTSPYHNEMEKRFASRSEWSEHTASRLKSWGFNALGAGCSSELRGRGLAYCEFLAMGESFSAKGGDYALRVFEGIPGSAFPNVFHKDFAAFCDERAAKLCAPLKNAPDLFGYFFDNELAWYGNGTPDTGLYDAAANAPAGSPAREALRNFLAGKKLSADGKTVPVGVKTQFVRLAAHRYFEAIAAAIRRHDPNHLLLGCRFAGLTTAHRVVWEESARFCDVVTFNQYPWADLDENTVYLWRDSSVKAADAFAERYAWMKKPMLITEWSFISLDSGLPCTGGYGQRFRTQAERVRAAELYSRLLFSLPYMIGFDYFMWVDEPALGISKKFPENSNYGLVNERGEAYAELTAMFARVNAEAEKIHAKGQMPKAKAAALAAKDRLARFRPSAIGAPDSSAAFVRKGDAYTLTTAGGLVLKGRVGGCFALDSVVAGGLDCGSFTFMVYNGAWQDIERVEAVKWLPKQGAMRISGTGKDGGKSFRVTADIVSIPGKPWFACNVVSVDNIGKEDFADVSVWLRQYAPWAKETAGVDGCKPVPDLWKAPASGVWIRPGDGAWCGAATYSRNVKQFIYYVGGDGSVHPDAAFSEHGFAPVAMPLPAGASWKPDGKAWMVAAAGRGGIEGWRSFVDGFHSYLRGAGH